MCGCISDINKHLEQFNTKIELPFWTNSGRLVPFVQTIKIDDKKRGKPQAVFASHCPFCGESYDDSVARTPQVTEEAKND
jgi:hypothetical protein